MKIFLVFSGEGKTDERFYRVLIERLIQEFLFDKKQTAEISWIAIPKKGSSQESILNSCALAKDHNAVIVHRDSDTQSLKDAIDALFCRSIRNDQSK
jgi:hypothetical protein